MGQFKKINNLQLYIKDLDKLRTKLANAENEGGPLGILWTSVRRKAQSAPDSYPWFVPFIALVTGEETDIENARRMIRNYVKTLYPQSFGNGVHFNFWCFAFPHARWALYFKWMEELGYWEPEEAEKISEELIKFQFIYFFSGLRSKPEPECVDNQTLALSYSNALIGYLFRDKSAMARRMLEEGFRRLPHMLGGFDESGYSGEGSTYMDQVVGPSIPLVVEFLEEITREDWFTKKMPPRNSSAEAILRMVARERMPNGLLLPWDHYGFQLPVRSQLAYAAGKTGDSLYYNLLENSDFSFDIGVGWGLDDLIWTIIWWPERKPELQKKTFEAWVEPHIGGTLVSEDEQLYLMQMWDEAAVEPEKPGRMHVNPNSLMLYAYGSPLTVDGVASKDCTNFQYNEAWSDFGHTELNMVRSNFGIGCAGAHNVIIVDMKESMRPLQHYVQGHLNTFYKELKTLSADVTPIYSEHWKDINTVKRRSKLCHDRFWLIEDLVVSENEHMVTSRWFLRPQQIATKKGVKIETAEGVSLHLIPLSGPDSKILKKVIGYPAVLDYESVQADFNQYGKECRWLWLAWPDVSRTEVEDISEGWQAVADPKSDLNYFEAKSRLDQSELIIPCTMPPFMLSEVEICRKWWYKRKIKIPSKGRYWLKLPRNMFDLKIWIRGKEIDVSEHYLRMKLMYPHIEIPEELTENSEIEVVLSCTMGISQYGEGDHEGIGFWGRPALMACQEPLDIDEAFYSDGFVTVKAGGQEWKVEYKMMKGE